MCLFVGNNMLTVCTVYGIGLKLEASKEIDPISAKLTDLLNWNMFVPYSSANSFKSV